MSAASNEQEQSSRRAAPAHIRHASDSPPPEDRIRPPPLDRNFSTSNILQGSVVPGFGMSSDVVSPTQYGASSPSFSSMVASPMHASWSIGDGDFLGDDYLGPSMGSAARLRGRGGTIHRSIGTQSISLRNMSQLAGDDPSMIHDAARIANWRTVLALCRTHPQSARYAGQDGWTALHHACNRRCPNADVAEALIRAFPDALLQVETQHGRTPLHLACRFKAPKDVVRLLLHLYPGRGREAVSKRDRKGRTPLYYAVRYDAPDGVVEMLLEVDPSVVLDEDRNADSPLAVVWDSWAEKFDGKKVLNPFLHPEKTSEAEMDQSLFLQQKMRSLPKLNKKWNTVNLFLRAAFRFPSVQDPITQMINESQELELEDDTGIGTEKQRQWRVLHATAAIKCHPTLFMLSMALYPEQAAEIDENDLKKQDSTTHQTALHFAATSTANGEGGRAVIAALLSHYPDAAQIADSDGSLPLHRIVENDRKAHWVFDGVRDVYIANPTAVKAADKLGRLPLHRAAAVSQHDGATKTNPVELGSVVCNLLEVYPEAASKPDKSGRLPLHVIAEHGEVWDEQADAVVNAHPAAARTRAGPHLYNRLPIHMAAASPDARRSLIERLVELHPRGVSQTDRLGKLPLHVACESGKTWDKGVEAIYNADPNAIREAEGNSRRWMALHMAAACPNAGADLINILAELYPNAAREPDTRGRYPLHLACVAGKSWEGGLQSIFEANPESILAWDQAGMLPFHVAAICYCSSSESVALEEDGKDHKEILHMSSSSVAGVAEDQQEAVAEGGVVAEGNAAEAAKTDMLFHLLRAEPSILNFI